MWRCSVCGFVTEGDVPPHVCPKCGAVDKFEEISQDEQALILKSRKTNLLHMELISLLSKAMCLCDEGIEDNLDPACVSVFSKAKEWAYNTCQSSKAELKGHMNKNKWN